MPYKPGSEWKGNANGRPRKPEIELFREALSAVEKKNDKSLLQHAVERAYIEDTVLIALLKKILPDKIMADVDINENRDRAAQAERMRAFLGEIFSAPKEKK
mgnify:CR=1 FL=1